MTKPDIAEMILSRNLRGWHCLASLSWRWWCRIPWLWIISIILVPAIAPVMAADEASAIPGLETVIGGPAPGIVPGSDLPLSTPGPSSSAMLMDGCELSEAPPYIVSVSPLGNPDPFSWQHKPVWSWLYPLMPNRHNGPVQAVAFSADGRLALSGGWDRTVRLWDVASGRQLRTFEVHDSWIKSVAFSADGKRVLAGSFEGTTRLWDILNGREIRRFEGGASLTAVSPDGKHLASAGRSGSIWLWDLKKRDPIARLPGHGVAVSSLSYSPDACFLLSTAWDRSARIWDLARGRETQTFKQSFGGLAGAAFSPDGETVATGDPWGSVRLWDVASGSLIRELGGQSTVQSPAVSALSFSPDGMTLIAAGGDGSARRLDIASGSPITRYDDGRPAAVPVRQMRHGVLASDADNRAGPALAISPDGEFALTGDGLGRVRLWQVASGQLLRCFNDHAVSSLDKLSDPTADVVARIAALLPDVEAEPQSRCNVSNNVAEESTPLTISQPERSALQHALDQFYQRNHGAAKRLIGALAASGNPMALMWQAYLHAKGLLGFTEDQELAEQLASPVLPEIMQAAQRGEPDAMTALAMANFSGLVIRQDRPASAQWYRRAAELGDDHAMMIMGLLYGEGRGVSQDDQQALAWFEKAAGRGNTPAMYFLAGMIERGRGAEKNDSRAFDWYRRAAEAGHGQAMLTLSDFYREGRGTQEDFEQSLSWLRRAADVENRAAMVTLGGLYHRGQYLNRDEQIAESWYRRAADLGDENAPRYLEGLRRKREAQRHLEERLEPAWTDSPSEDPKTGEGAPRLIVQVGHGGNINDAVFSPDGRFLLSAGDDPVARLWDVITGREIGRFYGHSKAITAVDISADGRFALTASRDRTVRLWEVSSGREIQRLQHSAPVNTAVLAPDGKTVFSGDENGAKRWELASARLLAEYKDHQGPVLSLALAPNGDALLSGSGDGRTVLWRVADGEPAARLSGHSEKVAAVAFSPEGDVVLTGDDSGAIHLWDVASGELLRSYRGDKGSVLALSFDPDGRRFAAVSSYAAVYLWDIDSTMVAKRFEGRDTVRFSPSGKELLSGDSGFLRLWDIDNLLELQRYQGKSAAVQSVAVSADGEFVLSSIGSRAALWNLRTGAEVRRFSGHLSQVGTAQFAPAAPTIVTGGRDGSARIWDLYSGEEIRRLFETRSQDMQMFGFGALYSLGLSPDGRFLASATGMLSNNIQLTNIVTGESVRSFVGHRDAVHNLAYSASGEFIVSGSIDGSARLWRADDGKELRLFEGYDFHDGGANLAFSADSRVLALGIRESATEEPRVLLWDLVGERELARLDSVSQGHVFSPDGRYLLIDSGHQAVLWRIAGAEPVRRFGTPSHQVKSIAVTPDQRLVLTGGREGVLKLWDFASGRELASLVSFTNGAWAVIDPAGRFDTDRPDGSDGLHWILPDAPFAPLPVEVLLREYYEPRLLPRILAGERLPPVAALTDLNRTQPGVEITEILADSEDTAAVTLRLQSVRSPSGQESGLRDVRLLRDGQLVAYAPKEGGEISLDPATGSATMRFTGIRVPRDGRELLLFNAYAFNDDRIKSATSSLVYDPGHRTELRRGKAYLINIGVNTYQNPAWNLTYAANDARLLQAKLGERLQHQVAWDSVIKILLVTDHVGEESSGSASKRQIAALLQKLAGRAVDESLLNDIPGAEQLSAVEPEDLVLITFSSHGIVDDDGMYYFFPADIGLGRQRTVDPALLKRLISSDELALWLRDIDAAEMVLIVDACYAAAVVEQSGFKPAPMGSRGLGQLAYDKGMRVLSASQADSFALESGRLQQGLLTYALVQDGLESGKADFLPVDSHVLLDEWLEYARRRVPVLNRDVLSGHWQREGRGARRPVGRKSIQRNYQQPALFDFSRAGRRIVLDTLH